MNDSNLYNKRRRIFFNWIIETNTTENSIGYAKKQIYYYN